MKKTARKLSKKLRKFGKNLAASKGVVLMYHRISNCYPDPWNLNVSEENFRSHLNLFTKSYNVLPLIEFNALRRVGKLPKRALTITFDDGYADNFSLAAPLMLEAEIPAMFYICTGTLAEASGMWWDTLAEIVYGVCNLPTDEKLQYEKNVGNMSFGRCQSENNASFDTSIKSMTDERLHNTKNLYMHLWEMLLPLPVDIQKQQLDLYSRELALAESSKYPMMLENDIKTLSEHSLFEIGAHTKNHVQLSAHDVEYQRKEVNENVRHLEDLTGRRIFSMSYPFGSYNHNTLKVAKQAGLDVACTTAQELATRIDNSLLLPRIMVNDVPAQSLKTDIERYFQ